jgi:anti-sigma factor RsiW
MSARVERVMAYVDGELTPAARLAFEAEMAGDPALAAEVEAHRALGRTLSAAFGPVADEPLPLRLTMAAQAANDAPGGPRLAWAAGMAASLVVGLLAGRYVLAPEPGVVVGAELGARTELARALEHGLAAQPGVVRIGLTFRDRDGRWCRTFQSGADRLAGLACRADGAWKVRLATGWTPPDAPAYRTAASEAPPEVLSAVDRAAAGEVMDAAQERAARDAGWR